ncbi:MAG: DUF202 domain-containing protein [Planctomycetota bacterium]
MPALEEDDTPPPTSTARDRLALERTRLANERTVLAYARTAIMLAATGVSLLKFFRDGPLTVAGGWILIAAAASVAVIGYRRCRRLAKKLDEIG